MRHAAQGSASPPRACDCDAELRDDMTRCGTQSSARPAPAGDVAQHLLLLQRWSEHHDFGGDVMAESGSARPKGLLEVVERSWLHFKRMRLQAKLRPASRTSRRPLRQCAAWIIQRSQPVPRQRQGTAPGMPPARTWRVDRRRPACSITAVFLRPSITTRYPASAIIKPPQPSALSTARMP